MPCLVHHIIAHAGRNDLRRHDLQFDGTRLGGERLHRRLIECGRRRNDGETRVPVLSVCNFANGAIHNTYQCIV